MKSERLIELIRHPEKIGSGDLRELETLVNRYPYFQTARILYLKALYTQAGGRFRNELKASTVHITDHKQLFRYLNEQLGFETDRRTQTQSLTDAVDERIREINGHLVVTSYGIPAYPQTAPQPDNDEEEMISLNFEPQSSPAPFTSRTQKTILRPVTPDSEIVSNPIMLDNIPGMITDYSEESHTVDTTKQPAESTYRQQIAANSFLPSDLSGIPGMADNITKEKTTPEVTAKLAPTLSMDIDLEEETAAETGKNDRAESLETPEILSSAYRLSPTEENSSTPIKEEKPAKKTKKKKDEDRKSVV